MFNKAAILNSFMEIQENFSPNQLDYIEQYTVIESQPLSIETIEKITGTWKLSTFAANPTAILKKSLYLGITFILDIMNGRH